ncbi:hypothetical protein ES703_56995 [subsurface metagenome]
MFDSKKRADFKVLSRLRHNTFISCDDECHYVNPGSTGYHVLNKLFMTGHIHDANNDTAGQL